MQAKGYSCVQKLKFLVALKRMKARVAAKPAKIVLDDVVTKTYLENSK